MMIWIIERNPRSVPIVASERPRPPERTGVNANNGNLHSDVSDFAYRVVDYLQCVVEPRGNDHEHGTQKYTNKVRSEKRSPLYGIRFFDIE